VTGERTVRLDQLVVERGLAPSRERAQAAILAGDILVNGSRALRPSHRVDPGAAVVVTRQTIPYVSRGGLKLEKALKAFAVPVAGRVAMDIGASTGGFTDCLLAHGAARVYAVDVGYGQLAWKLRQDPRVCPLERTNARYLTREALAAAAERHSFRHEFPSLATLDVSFISLDKILPAVVLLLEPPGDVIALVKPQFEAGRELVGKRGVVRDPATHAQVIAAVTRAGASLGLAPAGLVCSPVAGPEGNVEFLLWLVLHRLVSPGPASGPPVDAVEDFLAAAVPKALAEAKEVISGR
jgi:23S rRNA (cytidine1920-2'-O)/16S rRNA (cytidine1409-2'-O)-methyltransferase